MIIPEILPEGAVLIEASHEDALDWLIRLGYLVI
jgi:hypothetical protein